MVNMPSNPEKPPEYDENPFASPSAPVPQIGPSPASRLRRRLLAAGLFLAGCVMFAFRDLRPITATLLSPPFIMLGIVSFIQPLAIPDPKREFGVMQAWIDFGRKEARYGFVAFGIGLAIGMLLLLV
jgi:hypothetical protein